MTLVAVGVFATVSLLVLAVAGILYDICFRNRERIEERAKMAFRDEARDRATRSPLFRDLRFGADDSNTPGLPVEPRLQTLLAQAGVLWRVERFALVTAGSALVAGTTAMLFRAPWWAASLALVTGSVAPLAYVLYARSARMALLCRQLPEAFEAMSRALVAGQSMTAAFQTVADEFPMPIKEEFAHCYEQQHLGIPFDVALRDLARRTGFVETKIFAVALIVTRQSGGNLAELLTKLGATMRKRWRFQARVRALTGEGRMQAGVLIALPLVSFAAISMLDPSYAGALRDHPMLLAGMGVMQLLGSVCICKIINLSY